MKQIIPLSLLLIISVSSHAEVAVVVNPNMADTLDSATISKIFLGKSKRFPSGETATPINQDNNAVVDEFNKQVLKRSSSQVKAYWSKLLFTGKGKLPQQVSNDAEVLQKVAGDASAIGYVNSSSVNDSVKVVAKF